MVNAMNKIALLTTVSLISIASVSCTAKPEHPQEAQSFSERRVPKENALVQSSTVATNQKSSFQGVDSSKIVIQGSSSPTQTSTSKTITNTVQKSTTTQESGSTTKSSGSVLDSLKGIFGFETSSIEGSEKRLIPQENYVQLALNNYANEGQGSVGNMSHYESAEALLTMPSAQNIDEYVLDAPLEVAVVTQNKDLTAIPTPDESTSEQLIKRSESLPNPELKDVPQTPEKLSLAAPQSISMQEREDVPDSMTADDETKNIAKPAKKRNASSNTQKKVPHRAVQAAKTHTQTPVSYDNIATADGSMVILQDDGNYIATKFLNMQSTSDQ